MSKRYSDVLAEWVEKRTKGKRRTDAAAVAFLAVKSDVDEALKAGYAIKTIWEHMHETGRIQTGYEAFRKHVKRYIKTTPHPTQIGDQGKANKSVPKAKAKVDTPQEPKEMPSIGGFQFNPKPNKEDLL
ncbi:conjugal transfer protein TraK [Salmonella enterica subsp. enterica serovar Schwarzengrund]|nr:conjugal transfer protein TraK [Salmonella enterica subsp. enterica serovar Schwarzengrund]